MVGTKESNQRAKANGSLIEKQIYDRLIQSVDLAVDKCIYKGIDLIINGRYFEIKSCRTVVSSYDKKHRLRIGRFLLDKSQHEELLQQNGFYLFILSHRNVIVSYKIVKAKHIRYTRQKSWTTIWSNNNVAKTRLDELSKSIRNAISDNR